MPVCPYPNDREENTMQLSFTVFICQANILYNTMQDDTLNKDQYLLTSKDFFQFILAGCYTQNNLSKHITLNACQGLIDPVSFKARRDYDSLISATHNLPYSCHLSLFPVSPFRDALKKTNHIKAIAYTQVTPHSHFSQSPHLNSLQFHHIHS